MKNCDWLVLILLSIIDWLIVFDWVRCLAQCRNGGLASVLAVATTVTVVAEVAVVDLVVVVQWWQLIY